MNNQIEKRADNLINILIESYLLRRLHEIKEVYQYGNNSSAFKLFEEQIIFISHSLKAIPCVLPRMNKYLKWVYIEYEKVNQSIVNGDSPIIAFDTLINKMEHYVNSYSHNNVKKTNNHQLWYIALLFIGIIIFFIMTLPLYQLIPLLTWIEISVITIFMSVSSYFFYKLLKAV